MIGNSISGDVYAWTAVLILPINSALNPFLYTLSAVLSSKVKPIKNTGENSLISRVRNISKKANINLTLYAASLCIRTFADFFL